MNFISIFCCCYKKKMNAELNRAFIIFVFEYDKLKQNFGQTTETKQKKIHNEKIVFVCQ